MDTKNVKHVLQLLDTQIPIVWDRFTYEEKFDHYIIFGWISREDKQRDFILIEMDGDYEPNQVWYSTSSAKYTLKICEILYGETDDHISCRKIVELL